ncbi:MAG: hypothetical protein WKG32_19325 [Gemmatimonadaceae bacterium]
MSDRIRPTEMQTGDVMLYRGTSWLAKAIRLFDGTDVNHAAIYLGSQRVGESIKQGVVARDLPTSLRGNEWVLVRRLKDMPPDMGPVSTRADLYLAQGLRYAYEQILLLAFLGLTRKPKVTPVLRALLRTALDAAASALTQMIAAATMGKGRQPMICSEFVYRCYDEALPEMGDPYALRINMLPFTPAPSRSAPAGAMAVPAPAAPAAAPLRGQGIHPDSLLAWAATPAGRVWRDDGAGSAGSRPRGAARTARAARAAGTAASTGDADYAELDSLIKQYLVEVREPLPSAGPARAAAARARGKRRGPARTAATTVSDEELRASIDRFALALSAAELAHTEEGATPAAGAGSGRRSKGAAAPQSISISMAPPFANLLRTSSDFVTPGDLLKTESLFTLGRIEG